MELDSDIAIIKGLGDKTVKKLNKLGVFTLKDLFFNFPRKYEDYTKITQIKNIGEDFRARESYTVRGEIIGISNKKTRRRGFIITEAIVADATGTIKVVWFNQAYLARMLKVGSGVILHGRVQFDTFANSYVMESPVRTNRPMILPIYSETVGITSFFINKIVKDQKEKIALIDDFLPDKIIKEFGLISLQQAVFELHFPTNSEKLEQARRRMAFDELFLISLRSQVAKEQNLKLKAKSLRIDKGELDSFIKSLPFKLTGDQGKAAFEIVDDLEKPVPMNRLLNGDVGSGKTIVAAIASFLIKKNGGKTLIMVPTEILANQHCETFKKLFNDEVGIWTSSQKKANNDDFVIIGTQALIQEKAKFKNVDLIVTDEQHRFGVKQREALKVQNTESDLNPHFLSMTATPIPRTLHLALFGELDISVIREKPANRKEIKTRFVEPFNREKAYEFITKHLNLGRQAFVICPLIEESKEGDIVETLFEQERKTVKAEFEKLKEIFPKYQIEMLHGKMKPKEKDQIMADFSSGKTQILVSTSVVEVGIDVPNANIMLIEDAEHFGLAQLHQFRGRVGRGEHQSFCFLFSNTMSEKALSRLKGLESINDGFKLAELDLEMRGPGSIFGTEQSGLIDLQFASFSHWELINEAAKAAKSISTGLELYPLLQNKLKEKAALVHFE